MAKNRLKVQPPEGPELLINQALTIGLQEVRMLSSQYQELIAYPENRWTDAPSDRWVSLCDGLLACEASSTSNFPMDKERKWELVSAFQKAAPARGKAAGITSSFRDGQYAGRVCLLLAKALRDCL
jgi:hypothetical protein